MNTTKLTPIEQTNQTIDILDQILAGQPNFNREHFLTALDRQGLLRAYTTPLGATDHARQALLAIIKKYARDNGLDY